MVVQFWIGPKFNLVLYRRTWAQWISFAIWVVVSHQVVIYRMKCVRICRRLNCCLQIGDVASIRHSTLHLGSKISLIIQFRNVAVGDRCATTVDIRTPESV